MSVQIMSRSGLQCADIIINHAFSRISGPLTYAVPKQVKIEKGSLVLVPFRKQKKTGIVIKIHEKKPVFAIKEIEKTCLEMPALWPWQMSLFSWMQEYYFSDAYQTLKLFLPEKIVKGKFPKALCHSEPQAKNLTSHTLRTTTSLNQKITLFHHSLSENRFKKYAEWALSEWKNGYQTLVLTAEMGMAPRIAEIFQKYFQEKIMIFKSDVSEKEKAEIWLKAQNGDTPVIIGSRSALFLPFQKLGLIIMDQEHDLMSYKQEQTPRYNAKTIAMKITELTGAKLVLASHAPSIDSMYQCNSTNVIFTEKRNIPDNVIPDLKFAAATAQDQESPQTINARYLREKTEGPKHFTIIDLCDEIKKHNFSPISDGLREKMAQTLEKGQQIVLFLNKKGSATTIACRECGEHLQCKNCIHRTSFYRTKNLLKCNRCGWQEPAPFCCPNCKSPSLKMLGFGTEKLEKEVQTLFPKAKTLRMDTDVLKSQKQFFAFYEQIQKKTADIIIGTQLLLKKEHYPNVGLIAVILAD
ncbi:primosomal protein N', partial [Candidatus Peregrinibacteria bacterium]|nr:primosomal protein N' [Candidatus Peregrinibacteria bacterium]